MPVAVVLLDPPAVAERPPGYWPLPSSWVVPPSSADHRLTRLVGRDQGRGPAGDIELVPLRAALPGVAQVVQEKQATLDQAEPMLQAKRW
jgi:hypothetical protein